MTNLIIVESPAKAKTIEKFLGKDYTVKSSYGHVRDLPKNETSIDTSKNYQPNYQISEDKEGLVNELRLAVKKADIVWLASDEDREGEAIAWHLLETLNLDKTKTKRIVFNEITKNAIVHAIENPRDIDMNLVDAQQARRVLDRLVGYEISPILWSKIKPALSAGRVQSVAVRLIVERESEIKNFQSTSFFKVTALFLTDDTQKKVIAEHSRRFDTEQEAKRFLESIVSSTFFVENVDTRPAKRSPAPPFTTSTLQQEASRKLGYSVARTMQIAQQLYESGYITYMRTDSVNLSSLALNMAKKEIATQFGERYIKTRQYQTKTKGAQEAHEAIRPTDMTQSTISADPSLKRLYELIWKRTIASQMADAELEKTQLTIGISNSPDKFICQGEQVMFEGFLKVYLESTDDENTESTEDKILPILSTGMALKMETSNASQHFTQHPPRYTEASLVKKLEDLGIGRPSTYAPTISTILKREYVIKEDREPKESERTILTLTDGTISKTIRMEKSGGEKNKLFPTDIGTIVNQFLIEHFTDIMDYNFTAKVEKDFDEIADGKKEWRKVIDQFYVPFHKNILQTKQTSMRTRGERLLGVDPASGKNVYAKIGRFGTMIQIGETQSDEKPKFASMKKGQSIETITLEDALGLFSLPRAVGVHEGHEVVVSIGRYGPYIHFNDKYYPLGKSDDPYEINLERCLSIIENKRKQEEVQKTIFEKFPYTIGTYKEMRIEALIGKYGPYLTYKSKNYRIPKTVDPTTVTLNEAISIIENYSAAKPTAKRSVKKKT